MYNTAQRFGGYDAVSIICLFKRDVISCDRQPSATFIYVKPMRSPPPPPPPPHLFLDQTEGPKFFSFFFGERGPRYLKVWIRHCDFIAFYTLYSLILHSYSSLSIP